MTIYQHRTALESTILPSFENWKACLEGSVSGYTYEIPLYTDASIRFHGGTQTGPYQFIQVVPVNACEEPFRTIVILRVDVHIKLEGHEWIADLEKTDDTAYHGGDLNDEIAALLSLVHGIRLMPGSITREFSSGADPRGIPSISSSIPFLGVRHYDSVIPRLQRTLEARGLPEPFQTFPTLNKKDAVALVKAARLYQQAVWHADADPNQAWLMLVSALETAADHWWQKDATPPEILEDGNRELYELLVKEGGLELATKVAPLLKQLLGASKKFREFVLRFLPGPPERRPGAMGRFAFEEPAKLKEALQKIYTYRSQALHGGKPFPLPMCHSASRYGGDEELSETPTGLATGTLGSSWKHEDTPMVLHTFEHIVRTSLIAWWQSMVK